MKLYRFSPIKSKEELLQAVEYLHTACHELCKQSFGKYLPVVGNVGIFCHYEDEYEFLTKLREELTDGTISFDNKYFKLYEPVTVSAKDDIPAATYIHLYIRKPDPYRSQVGDVDFYLEPQSYEKLKTEMLNGKKLKGARVFERGIPDMIELFDPDIDALSYVWPGVMAGK